jgi:subtilase family serine protease
MRTRCKHADGANSFLLRKQRSSALSDRCSILFNLEEKPCVFQDSLRAAPVLLALAAVSTSSAFAQLQNNVSAATHLASDLGPVDPSHVINVTIHLKPQNEAAFERTVDALYDPTSPTYHHWLTDDDLKTFAPLKKVQASGGFSSVITNQILSAPSTFTFTTPGASLPVGIYYGNVYGGNPKLVPDYTPAQLQQIYGLTDAYKQRLNGKGQTIVLLEAYGYPTIEQEANAFSKLAGIP